MYGTVLRRRLQWPPITTQQNSRGYHDGHVYIALFDTAPVEESVRNSGAHLRNVVDNAVVFRCYMDPKTRITITADVLSMKQIRKVKYVPIVMMHGSFLSVLWTILVPFSIYWDQ